MVILLLVLGCFLFLGNVSLGWEIDYPGGGPAAERLPEYIVWLFNFACTIAGVVAALMIIIGGVQYMASGGNPGLQNDAKDRITKAIIGLVLLFCVYLILNTINPDLINLRLPNLPSL
jgi:cytochrome bd-type quinol oxidase subunit 2